MAIDKHYDYLEKNKQAIQDLFFQFCETIGALRHPTKGCPWDLSQSHETLRHFMVEEAYEASEAMHEFHEKHSKENAFKFCDELGDVLLQVVLNAQMASEQNWFTIHDVVKCIEEKMKRRHPHVFGSEEEKKQNSLEQIYSKWDEIKSAEAGKSSGDKLPKEFKKLRSLYPATSQALKIGKYAKKLQFDWAEPKQVLDQLRSEVDEFVEAFEVKKDSVAMRDEIGDLYFTLAQLCRHLDFDPEDVAFDGNRKFLRRFQKVIEMIQEKGLELDKVGQRELEKMWVIAKSDLLGT